jgi:small subunit ribosomal protein S8
MKNYLNKMFNNIINGQIAKNHVINQTRKKICESFLKFLWAEGFILGYEVNQKNKKKLNIFLKYVNNRPTINVIKLVSTPSKRVYYSSKQIWKINSSKSLIVFSTNKGLQSISDCKKLKIGGEPFIIIN